MLHRLKSLQKKISVAIVGLGAMGKGLLYQCRITPGIECVAAADIRLDKASAAAESLGIEYRLIDSPTGMQKAIEQGVLAVCEDGLLPATCPGIDVFIEASNSIVPAARFSLAALEHGKHLVLMNAEIDLIFGPYLLERARQHGVMYLSCDGDQHVVLKHLIDDLHLWGFELVMAGNIKGFLDRYANPTTIILEADKRNLDYKMATAYTDGTKLCIEMALVANALGLVTMKPGMSGHRAEQVKEVFQKFDLQAIRDDYGAVVDYILGAQPDGGVFGIGYSDHDYQRSMLAYYKMGPGPFYLFYRPYHLCHVEAMACIAQAVLDGFSILEPDHGLKTNVIAYAKRDLPRGERLDGIGGYCCYGLIENNETGLQDGLPICLAEDVVLKRSVIKDQKVTMMDIDYDPHRFDFDLYRKSLAVSPPAPP